MRLLLYHTFGLDSSTNFRGQYTLNPRISRPMPLRNALRNPKNSLDGIRAAKLVLTLLIFGPNKRWHFKHLMSEKLGYLQPVELNDIWPDEAQDFTPWLAEEENLIRLGKTLDMDLELEAQEINVGKFRADILCKNTGDDSWIVIENQLERTNHKHLGQILTYSAGLNAYTIVWIAKEFEQEHLSALHWLNEITHEHFQR